MPSERVTRTVLVVLLTIVIVGALLHFWPQRAPVAVPAMASDAASDEPATPPEVTAEPVAASFPVPAPAAAPVAEPAEPVTVTLRFPSGETLTKTLRRFTPSEPPVEYDPVFVNIHDQLVDAAVSGDAASARDLYHGLKSCRNAWRTESELETAVTLLKETGQVTYPAGSSYRDRRLRHSGHAADVAEMMRTQYESCVGLTEEQLNAAEDWLYLAADSGDFLAIRELAHHFGDDSEASAELYQQLWERGHVSATEALGIAYSNGTAPGLDGQPDHIRSYAYTYAGFAVYKAIMERSNRPGAHNRIVSMDDVLAMRGGYLSPQQQAQAEQLAYDMLRENENCCLTGIAGN